MTVETETVNARPLNPADFDRHFSTLPQFLTVGAASLLVAKKQKSSSNKKRKPFRRASCNGMFNSLCVFKGADTESLRAVSCQVPRCWSL